MPTSNFADYLLATFFSKRALGNLLFVILTAASLAYLNRELLSANLYETGDFAANSVLVQQAKHFQLLVGNYSRVGFNHPGPALLYVLAAGEWFFHDLTGLAKSPLGGQMVAQSIYSAFWLVLLAGMLIRGQQSRLLAIAGLAAFLAATACLDHNVLTGLWFPDLYYLPFAAFTVALVLLASGQGESLVVLALSSGFLVHGHVSFVAICGFMVLGSLLANEACSRRDVSLSPVLSREFFRANRHRLVAAAVVLFVFAIPFLLESLRSSQSPLSQYLAVGRIEHKQTWSEVWVFVAGFWGKAITPLLSAALVLLLLSGHAPTAESVPTRARFYRFAALLFVLATAAFALYARFGIDDLAFEYVGIFYFAIPALLGATVLGRLSSGNDGARVIAIAVLVLSIPYVISQTRRPLDYVGLYNDDRIPFYFSRLNSLDRSTMVLDLDTGRDWPKMWATLAGIQAYSLRHRQPDLFCIDRGWHVLFSRQAKCTAAQLKSDIRYQVTTAPLDDAGAAAVAVNLDGLQFIRIADGASAEGKP